MSFKLNMSLTKQIKPKSDFIELITIKGNDVTIKMKDRPTLYHYKVDDNTLGLMRFYARKGSRRFGHLYNRHLKGHSYAKTVFS